MTAHWSLGTLVGLPIAGFIALICLVILVIGVVYWLSVRKDGMGESGDWIPATAGFVCLVITLAITGIVYYPFSSQYHRWEPKTGTVTDISSRFLGDGSGGTSQKFVVEFANDPAQRYGCNDTRCSLVKEGDTLTLSCKRTWQYAGEDGWDCNYVKVEQAAG